ncbi:MAG TPA: anthranilate 1,2-dioxygenase small subunit AndAd [Caulobacteraceae bacterium]|jgi:anthranilate 1,2-dioxygenase small subunit|nr:anthranilate 1,2-dioxygenase small subunit AndAd [Caulobacteraceae bacterium]
MTPYFETVMAVRDLMDRYISAIDNDHLEMWPEFFTDDCVYEIIPKENVDLGLPAPLIYCDNKRMLRDRVVSLRHANIFSPTTYRHFASGLTWKLDGEDILTRSNYLVINTSQAGQSIVYQTGVYADRLVWIDGALKFKVRRAIYDTSRVQTLLALPV